MHDRRDPPDPRSRIVRRIGAIVLIATGLVWIGQGTGVIPGSFMTGDPFWAAMGGASLIVGVIVARLSFGDGGRPG
jgi:hypothetical protein